MKVTSQQAIIIVTLQLHVLLVGAYIAIAKDDHKFESSTDRFNLSVGKRDRFRLKHIGQSVDGERRRLY